MSEIHSNVMVSVQKQNMSVQYHPMVSLKDRRSRIMPSGKATEAFIKFG